MFLDPRADRLEAILNRSGEIDEYERWLDAQRRVPRQVRDYLYSEDEARFEPRKEDVVVLRPGLRLASHAHEVVLRDEGSAFRLTLAGVERGVAERILRAIDGQRCLLEVRLDAGVDPADFARFLRATFGVVLFAPEAVTSLEERLSCAEIVRFPGPPYTVERSYWANMIDARARLAQHYEAAMASTPAFFRLLRELHVVALMGAKLDSYYKPRSPISDHIVAPGRLYLDEPRLRMTARGYLYFDGPRVSLNFVGGGLYHRALYESLDDPEALADARVFQQDGLAWGQFCTARSEREEEAHPWFFPPRPIREEHLEFLRAEFEHAVTAARSGDRNRAVRCAARFHQAFIRVHPFHCANQSLAMNLANFVLGQTEGAGIPHLILDHLALRLSTVAYERAFARSVNAWAVRHEAPAERFAVLRERRQRALSLMRRSAGCRSLLDFATACQADQDAARWALLADGAPTTANQGS